ncbi:sensor kinase [Ahrensia sp. R2A130]|nr:PAS domain-containing sensor histidine kinase [Ahrensia sp. R2A130]EFL90407.1 sensor kinase [Ahrensia sp. R2A130]
MNQTSQTDLQLTDKGVVGDEKPDPQAPLIDRAERVNSVTRLLVVGLVLLGFMGLFTILPDEMARRATLIILGLLAMVGVFFVFSLAIGWVHLSSRTRGDTFAKSFLDGLSHGAVVIDWNGRIVYANHSYGDMTGATKASDVATVERVFAHSDEASEIVYRMNQKVRAGETVTEEFRMIRDIRDRDASGEAFAPRWYRLTVRPQDHEDHKRPLLVWEISDVTQERARQESVFQELQHAIDYLDHAPAGFFSAGADGGIVYLNATLADWLGIDLAQFKPGSISVSELILGDGAALLGSLEVEPGESGTSVVDLDLARSNGQSLPVRLYHKVPYSQDGAPGATRTLVLNRSAGEGISEELRAAEVRFTRFFNNTPIAIASFAEDGSMVQSNAPFQRLFAPVLAAAKRHRKDGITIDQLCGENERDALLLAMQAANDGKGEIAHVDSTLPSVVSNLTGEEASVRYLLSAVADGEASDDATGTKSERAILYAIDMTEQKELERQMAQTQKMTAVGQLAGGIAHDFNNVLTAIIGFSDLLLANHRPSDPSFPDIMQIKQNANRAAVLVRQLLAFSRRQTLRPQTLSVPDVLSDLRLLLERLVGDKIKLDMKHGRDLWNLKADIGQFEQVVVNLCVNARDAINDTPQGHAGGGGAVTVSTRNMLAEEVKPGVFHKELPAADYVVIEVSDTGTGMSPEVMQKIFDPFFSTKDVGKGTGLGLSTVYGIIKQSGGYIFPESEVGQGTTFAIYLPRHETTAAEAQEAIEEAKSKKDEGKRDLAGRATIVFVEDEDSVRAVGCRTLQARGYTVHEAENGVEALELLEEYGDEVTLVVSDVVMPEMDGPTLLSEVRKLGNSVPFIFASGYAEDAFEKNLPESEHGKFGFIPKPYSLKQLATAVKEQLDGEVGPRGDLMD